MNEQQSRILALAEGLNHELRLRMVQLVYAKAPLTTNRIAEMLDVRPSVVSHHLQILARTGWVRLETSGRYKITWPQDGEQILTELRNWLESREAGAES